MKNLKMILMVMPLLLVNNLAFAETKYVNTSSGLKIRELCSTESDIVTVMPNNSEVEVSDIIKIEDRFWAKVKYEGLDKDSDKEFEGYCVDEFLATKKDNDQDKGKEDTGGKQSQGVWLITAYTHTGFCCSNGNYPTAGYTVACNSLPFGTRIYIEGIGERVVEDRGPSDLGSQWIDLFCDSYDECAAFGAQYREVFICE